MDAKEVIDAFLNDIQTAFPDLNIPTTYSTDDVVKHIETDFYPDIMKILQRDASFFDKPRMFCGIDLSQCWSVSESNHEAIWKHLQMTLFSSFLHGDIKEKVGSILGIVKKIWNGSDQTNDEITKILEDENTEGYIEELLTFLSETRIAKVFQEIVEEFDINDLNLNFQNPQEIIDTLRNPENPVMKNVVNKVQAIMKRKMETGQITQNQLIGEIEAIKAKVQSLFGNVFNEMLGGNRSEVPSQVLMGNSPEARRQRMIARLQKKQREKNSR